MLNFFGDNGLSATSAVITGGVGGVGVSGMGRVL